MTLLTFKDEQGQRVGERWYMVSEPAGRRLTHEAASLAVLLQEAIGNDSLPRVTRDLLLARALATAEQHAQSLVIYFDDKPVDTTLRLSA